MCHAQTANKQAIQKNKFPVTALGGQGNEGARNGAFTPKFCCPSAVFPTSGTFISALSSKKPKSNLTSCSSKDRKPKLDPPKHFFVPIPPPTHSNLTSPLNLYVKDVINLSI